MPDPLISAEIKGLKEVQAKMTQVVTDMRGDPMREGMAKATLLVTRTARKPGYVPVDRGQLRANITPEVTMDANVVQGIVGANVKQAAPQELGTRPFTPPWEPLFQWAMRKTKGNVKRAGALAATARASISIRGIKAKRYLQRALEDNSDKIFGILGKTVTQIMEK